MTGNFYVDDSCIDCDLCRETAPASFQRDDQLGMSLVVHQPQTPKELEEAQDAMRNCPSESIGNDGMDKQLAKG